MGSTSFVSFRSTKDGKRRWVIDIKYIDRQGRPRRYRRDAKVQAKEAAELEAQELWRRILTDGDIRRRDETMTVRAFVEGPFEKLFLRSGRLRPSTVATYRGCLPRILESYGHLRLDEITQRHHRAFEALLQGAPKARVYLTVVRGVLRESFALGVVDEKPPMPKLPRPSPVKVETLTDDELAAYLAHAKGWLRTAIALAAYAGLRRGEVCALRVRDVDMQEGVIRVQRALSAGKLLTPKNGKPRVVPIAEPLQPMLAEAMRLAHPEAPLLRTSRGVAPAPKTLVNRLHRLQSRLGLPPRTFHDLRHRFVSTLVSHGASLRAVQALVGHSSLSVTARYAHVLPGDLRSTIARL